MRVYYQTISEAIDLELCMIDENLNVEYYKECRIGRRMNE